MPENINFINLNEKEIHLVLSWRNNQDIRKWMYNQNEISLKDHLAFIQKLKTDSKKDYFLIKDENEYLGVVDLNDDYLGIYANPNKKRVGDILLQQIIDFAFKAKKLKILKAIVYEKNLSAIKLYERFGFITQSKKDEMLMMELKNENR